MQFPMVIVKVDTRQYRNNEKMLILFGVLAKHSKNRATHTHTQLNKLHEVLRTPLYTYKCGVYTYK